MAQKIIGYIAWNTKRNKPWEGTRRFKVWTTERQACHSEEYAKVHGIVVLPVTVEVPDGQAA